MKQFPLALLFAVILSGCSSNSTSNAVFEEPNANTYVKIEITNERGSVSKVMQTPKGERKLDLSGEGVFRHNSSQEVKRKAIFRITETSQESFSIEYDISYSQGSWEEHYKGEEKIRFDQRHYLLELAEGYSIAFDLIVEPGDGDNVG